MEGKDGGNEEDGKVRCLMIVGNVPDICLVGKGDCSRRKRGFC